MLSRSLALWVCAGLLTATSCSPSQQQRAQTEVNDALITAQIRAKISAIDAATVSNVHVNVVNRTVTLSGEVPSLQEHSKIVAATRSVAGVGKIVDELKINPKAPTAKELGSDLSLQARIKTALTEQTGVNAFRVRVSVYKGAVLLEGNVASKTIHTLVLETVRTVPGVRQLTDRVTVGKP